MKNRSCPLHSLSLVAQYCCGVHNFSATWLFASAGVYFEVVAEQWADRI